MATNITVANKSDVAEHVKIQSSDGKLTDTIFVQPHGRVTLPNGWIVPQVTQSRLHLIITDNKVKG